MAAPEQIARQAILNGARVMKDQSDFCMLEGPDHMLSNLAKVVALNLDQPFLADTVLEFWPACRDTDEMVVEHVKSGAATGDWQARLAQKIAALEAGPPLAIRELVTVVGACRALKDKALLHKAYALALERWPAEYDAHSAIFAIFRFHMESLPDDIKGRLVEKARRTLESGTEFQRGQAREILEEAR